MKGLKKFRLMITTGALLLVMAIGASSASASATVFSWGPGVGGYVGVWATDTWANSSAVGQYAYVESGRFDKANRCGTGVSIWYTQPNGATGNWYQVNNGCTPGPQFWYRAYFTARHWSYVRVTYRAEWQWYSGPTYMVH